MYLQWLRPLHVLSMSSHFIPTLTVVCLFFFTCGLYCCCWVVPSDFQQGENARAIFIHVPAAWMSLLIYGLITITSLIYLVTKHPLINLLTETGCQIGALFTLLTLCSGCLWGKPMWGTFWVWDARLTSVLILFCIYCAALRFCSISAEVSSIFICCGFINIPIIKFSVNWWNTLHQPSSISQFGTSIHLSMLIPILLMFACFVCLFLLFFFFQTRKTLFINLQTKTML